jgi:hypothetical protein
VPAATTHFLNVDLDLTSRKDLGPLVEALGAKVVLLHSGRKRGSYGASLELTELRYRDADACIARFIHLVRRLPPSARRLWDGATARRFDVGIQAGAKGASFSTRIKAGTLRRVAEIGGELAITVYVPAPRRRPRSSPALSR